MDEVSTATTLIPEVRAAVASLEFASHCSLVGCGFWKLGLSTQQEVLLHPSPCYCSLGPR